MNSLIFEKYRDRMQLTETWLSTHDFLPLFKASIHRYIIFTRIFLFFLPHDGFTSTYCILVFYYFPLNYSWPLFSRYMSLLFIRNIISLLRDVFYFIWSLCFYSIFIAYLWLCNIFFTPSITLSNLNIIVKVEMQFLNLLSQLITFLRYSLSDWRFFMLMLS